MSLRMPSRQAREQAAAEVLDCAAAGAVGCAWRVATDVRRTVMEVSLKRSDGNGSQMGPGKRIPRRAA